MQWNVELVPVNQIFVDWLPVSTGHESPTENANGVSNQNDADRKNEDTHKRGHTDE